MKLSVSKSERPSYWGDLTYPVVEKTDNKVLHFMIRARIFTMGIILIILIIVVRNNSLWIVLSLFIFFMIVVLFEIIDTIRCNNNSLYIFSNGLFIDINRSENRDVGIFIPFERLKRFNVIKKGKGLKKEREIRIIYLDALGNEFIQTLKQNEVYNSPYVKSYLKNHVKNSAYI